MPNAALRIERPSPEHELLHAILREHGEITIVDPWDMRAYSRSYDVAFCVGPVSTCPLAKTRVLFVLGPVAAHRNFDWDVVVVTSQKAAQCAMAAFGTAPRVYLATPPLLDMEAGRRRLMDQQTLALCASGSLAAPQDGNYLRMAWWTLPKQEEVAFSALEFNSLCRHGAYGVYGGDDGYDIQVRRHLALGSPVICPCARDVIGDLADMCSTDEPKKLDEPVKDDVTKQDYAQQISEAIRRVW